MTKKNRQNFPNDTLLQTASAYTCGHMTFNVEEH